MFEASSTNSGDPDQTGVSSGSTLFASIFTLTNKQTFSDAVILQAFKGLIICFVVLLRCYGTILNKSTPYFQLSPMCIYGRPGLMSNHYAFMRCSKA